MHIDNQFMWEYYKKVIDHIRDHVYKIKRRNKKEMNEITNVPTAQNDKIELMRSNFEHRATWMGLIYDEAKTRGIDLEETIRAAILKTGCIHGGPIKASLPADATVKDFALTFLNDNGVKCFQMTFPQITAEKVDVEFGFCPLVSAWQKLGFDQKTIVKLCDMAMDGDRGIAETAGIDFELGETIAKGHSCCELHFSKPTSK